MTDPVDFIPAGRCCCEQASWFGKRPKAAPLTHTFIQTAVKGGSIVPPHDGERRYPGLGLLVVIATCVLSFWLCAHWW
jgi:hypothetical protein